MSRADGSTATGRARPSSRRRAAEFAQALRELGLAGARAARRRAARPAASRRTSGASTPRAARSASSARWPSCASRPTGARRSSATATRRAGCRSPTRRVPGAAPRVLGQHDAPGVLVMSYSPPARLRAVEGSCCATATPMPRPRAPVGAALARIHAATGGAPGARGAVPDRRDLPRHPPRALPARDRARAIPTSRRRCDALVATHRSDQASRWCMATSARRTSCSAPDGPVFLDAECAWWGDPAFDLAFCLNHLLLKCLWTPPATAGVPRLLRRAGGGLSRRASTGSRAARSSAARRRCCRGCCWRASTASRRSSTSPTRPTSERVRRVARRAAAATPVERLARDARPPGARSCDCMSDARRSRPIARPPRLGQPRPADGRGRGARSHGGAVGRAIAPAGASTGTGEALDLRDGGAAFGGLDVTRAVAQRATARSRAPLAGAGADDQAAVDARLIELDGTPDKSRLGANATLAVSMAAAHAAAAARGVPLWRYLGGADADAAAAAADPDLRRRRARRPAASTSRTSWSSARARRASPRRWTGPPRSIAPPASLMHERGTLAGVADEGGWWPDFATNEEALATLVAAIERAGFAPGEQVAIALDVAASRVRPRRPLHARPRDSASSTPAA